MNKRVLILLAGLMVLALGVVSGCHQTSPDDWSFSKKTRTFNNANVTVQIVKAKKIALPNGDKAVRIYYKITNHQSQTLEAYPLLVDAINKISQSDKVLETVSFEGKDADEKSYASRVTIKPRETKEVVQDYWVSDFSAAVNFSFINANYTRVASYSLETSHLTDAPISQIKVTQTSSSKLNNP